MMRRDLTVRAGDVLRASPRHVYIAPFGVLSLAILTLQVLLRLWLRRRRIEVFADRVRIRGVLRETEVPIQGVVSVVQHYDMHALSSSLRLHYHAKTRVGKISGWLISARALEALGAYIVARNGVLQATMEGRLH